MRIPQAIASVLLGSAATIVAAQDPPMNRPKPQNEIQYIEGAKKFITNFLSSGNKLKLSETKFDIAETKKLTAKLGNNLFADRERAYLDLMKMPDQLSSGGLNDFLDYILDETAKPTADKPISGKEHFLETKRRLEGVQRRIFEVLKDEAANSKSDERIKVALNLIETMDKKRSSHVWKQLTPVVADIVVKGEHKKINWDPRILVPLLNPALNLLDQGSEEIKINREPKIILPLSDLLLSPFAKDSKDSKELQTEAVKLIVSLTKPPLREQEIFISFHNMKLKALTQLPEDKLSETEAGLKELKALYLQTNFSNSLISKLTQSSIPYLEELLERNIDAFSTNDSKKQKIAMNNINALKKQFDFPAINRFFIFPEVKNLVNPKNGASVFKRQEFSKNITNAKELESSIQTALFVSEFSRSRSNINYHKGYGTWLEKQVDNPELPKFSDREEMENTLESALIQELCTVVKSRHQTDLQTEMISPLVKTYTKLAKQGRLDRHFLEKNLDAIVDFQYSSYYGLNYTEQEKLQPDLLALFDTVTKRINDLKDTNDKASLRAEVATVVSFVTPKGNKDYVDRLSDFYSKEINTNEFMKLTDSLLNSPDSEHVGKHLPPAIMLQFIETNPKYFEDNVKHIIETYKKSDAADTKSKSKTQLQEIYSSFHRLFRLQAENNAGSLVQYFPRRSVINTTISSTIYLPFHPELRERIQRIETGFNKNLEKSIGEVIRSEGK